MASPVSTSAAATSARAELRALLQQVSARCAELPTALNVAALRKPGAWRDHPLPPNSPDAPYWIALPAMLEITNLSALALRAALADAQPVSFGEGGSLITISVPARVIAAPPTRADISQAVLAKTIATLGAANPLQPAIAAALARTTAPSSSKLAAAAKPANAHLTGDGTAAAPFKILGAQPLYLQAPVTLVFPNVPPPTLLVSRLFSTVSSG